MQIALHHNRRFLSFKMNRSGRFEMEPNPSIFASTIFSVSSQADHEDSGEDVRA